MVYLYIVEKNINKYLKGNFQDKEIKKIIIEEFKNYLISKNAKNLDIKQFEILFLSNDFNQRLMNNPLYYSYFISNDYFKDIDYLPVIYKNINKFLNKYDTFLNNHISDFIISEFNNYMYELNCKNINEVHIEYLFLSSDFKNRLLNIPLYHLYISNNDYKNKIILIQNKNYCLIIIIFILFFNMFIFHINN